jgi:hypothetical protein
MGESQFWRQSESWFLWRTQTRLPTWSRKFIIAVESETDHLPVGEVRKPWASYALREKDVEIAHAEELYRTDFLQTCRKIVNPNCTGQ